MNPRQDHVAEQANNPNNPYNSLDQILVNFEPLSSDQFARVFDRLNVEARAAIVHTFTDYQEARNTFTRQYKLAEDANNPSSPNYAQREDLQTYLLDMVVPWHQQVVKATREDPIVRRLLDGLPDLLDGYEGQPEAAQELKWLIVKYLDAYADVAAGLLPEEVNKQNLSPVVIGNEIARGGEGIVYTIQPRRGHDAEVVKIWHRERQPDIPKLRHMITRPPRDMYMKDDLSLPAVAWPTELYMENGKPRGFIMPEINTKNCVPLLKLYNPMDRRETSPYFNYRYLVRATYNMTVLMSHLHQQGYVLGDVNESNFMVDPHAAIIALDCDAYKVPNGKGGYYPSAGVGKPEYSPPEYYDRPSGVDYTQAGDAFALHVLTFMFLMEGRHPFAFRWRRGGAALSHGESIRGGYFPYAENNSEILPPPYALDFAILSPRLQGIFKRCFVDGLHRPELRPTAAELGAAIKEYEVNLVNGYHDSRCDGGGDKPDGQASHVFYKSLPICPWCARKRGLNGNDPFPEPPRQ